MRFSMSLRKIGKEIHETALKKGWWENPRNVGEILALIHSEVSEALEAVRENHPALYFVVDGKEIDITHESYPSVTPLKPEGVLSELADVVIRVLDWCEERNWDLGRAILLKMAYNRSRPYKHGGKAF